MSVRQRVRAASDGTRPRPPEDRRPPPAVDHEERLTGGPRLAYDLMTIAESVDQRIVPLTPRRTTAFAKHEREVLDGT